MELKLIIYLKSNIAMGSFNRTFMELKRGHHVEDLAGCRGFNRTFMELKRLGTLRAENHIMF